MSITLSILATGSELLDGRVVDTNSSYVGADLAERGLRLKRVLVVDDDMQELLAGLHSLSAVSDIVITSGGLGPTSDDLTRDLVAQFFGVGLAEHPAARAHLEQFFGARGRKVDESNLKQALLPIGAQMIPNPLGSAPGFMLSAPGRATVCSLSGVPREFKSMYHGSVEPLIRERSSDLPRYRRCTLKSFGIPESVVGKIVSAIALPQGVIVSYRAAFPEVHVVLKGPESVQNLEQYAAAAREALGGGVVYTESAEQSFVQRLQQLLIESGSTVATAESCTGGMVGELLTRTPGASAVYLGGVGVYQNGAKQKLLGVPADTLAQHGAVSPQTVEAMAAAVRREFGATFGVAVSGVAGPDGGTPEKPVGLCFVGIASPHGVCAVRCFYPSERQNVRVYASYVALDLVRRSLLGLDLPAQYPERVTV